MDDIRFQASGLQMLLEQLPPAVEQRPIRSRGIRSALALELRDDLCKRGGQGRAPGRMSYSISSGFR
jgi:hypothetical protein